jgi:ubiquinone/menaquinone biosynthesis C-methylase UbiE
MQATTDEIKKWESVEVERSASEAERREVENLRLDEKNILRYMSPPEETPYSLEFAYHLLGEVKGQKVLDYGCGAGENSTFLALRGAKVCGVDISPELLELAKQRLKIHNVGEDAEFLVGSAHDLPVPDESIDVVFGMAILHHLDLELSSKEVFRVLKKGGRAIFLEPVRNSKLMWFIRGLIPYQQPDLSPFERPLSDAELENYAKNFTNYKSRAFNLPYVNLVEVLTGQSETLLKSIRLDAKVLKALPFLGYYGTVRVIEMTK